MGQIDFQYPNIGDFGLGIKCNRQKFGFTAVSYCKPEVSEILVSGVLVLK